MTFQNLIQTGNGSIAYRLRILGCDVEFVSTSEMVRTVVSGPVSIERALGLKREGFVIAEKAILPESKVEVDGNTFTIVDIGARATRAFVRARSSWSNLVGQLSNVATTVSLTNRNISSGTIMWIGQEVIRIASAGTPAFTGASYTIERGLFGTIPQFHYVSNDLGARVRPFCQNVPFGYENARCELYAYGETDDFQGDGTLIWKGIITEAPKRISGLDWTIQCASLTEAWQSDIGVDIEPVGFSGYYFGGEIFSLYARWTYAGTTYNITAENLSAPRFQNTFYPDLPSFAQAIVDGLTENTPAFIDDLRFGYEIIGGELLLTYFVDLDGSSDIVYFGWGAGGVNVFDPPDVWTRDSTTGNLVPMTRSTNRTLFYWRLNENFRPFPSSIQTYGAETSSGLETRRLWLDRRIDALNQGLINSAILLDAEDEVVAVAEGIGISGDPANPLPGPLTFGGGLNYLDIRFPDPNFRFSSFDERGPYKLKLGTCVRKGTNVVGFLKRLTEVAPRIIGSGFFPLLYADDFDFEDMFRVLQTLTIPRTMKYKSFVYFSKGTSLEEVISNEFQQLGVYPCLTSSGKITIRPLKNVSTSDVIDHDINSDVILTDGEFPLYSTNDYGVWTSMKVFTGWNPIEEEHVGDVLTFNDVPAISQNRNKIKTLEISEFSTSRYFLREGSIQLASERIQNYIPIFERFISMFGKQYAVVTLEVPFTFYETQIGDTVAIRSKQLPSTFTFDGTRFGQSTYLGFIIARHFDMETGFGTLTMYVSIETVDGVFAIPSFPLNPAVAPTAPVTSASIDGNILDAFVGFENTRLPTGALLDNFFRPGDAISFTEIDAFEPGIFTGIVEEVIDLGAGQFDVRVDFASGVPGAVSSDPSNFSLGFANVEVAAADSLTLTDHQLSFAYVDTGVKEDLVENPVGNLPRFLRI